MTDPAAAAAAAAAIASRLSAVLGQQVSLPQSAFPQPVQATAAVSHFPFPAPASDTSGMPDPATIADPVERAKAIAARLGLSVGGSSLGKRKADDMSSAFPWSKGDEAKKQKKLYIPANNDINYMGLLIGPKGRNQKELEAETGAKIYIRGRGASKEGSNDPDADDDLHVVVMGDTDESVGKAEEKLLKLFHDPAYAMEVKRNQLRALAAEKMGGDVGAGAGAFASMAGSGGMPGMGMGSGGGLYGPGSSGMGGGAGGMAGKHGEHSETFGVPSNSVGSVIGRGGETIRDVQQRTQAHIQIQQVDQTPVGATERQVTVSGTLQAVTEAKQMIMNIVEREKMQQAAMAQQQQQTGQGGGMPQQENVSM